MTHSLKGIIKQYGTETVIARMMEQIRLLTEAGEVRDVAVDMVNQYKSDTEYIYSLCEFTHLVAYASDKPYLSDDPWEDKKTKKELEGYAKVNELKCRVTQISLHPFSTQG